MNIVFIENSLTYLTFFSHLFIIVLGSYLIFRKFGKLPSIEYALKLLKKYSIILAFIVALTATLGSLYFSEVVGYDPCKLCWFQRIFMYPLVIILGLGLIKKRKDSLLFSKSLAAIGSVFALYHVSLRFMPSTGSCSAEGTSCLIEYFTGFGYINIPVMALTAFILIIIFSNFRRLS